MTDNFDFSAVTVQEAELPKNGAGRPRRREDNPFTEVLAASYEAFQKDENAGRSIVLPGKAVAEAVYLIRQASDDLNIGARILLRKSNGDSIEQKDCKSFSGKVTVLFAGKARKQAKKSTESADESAGDSEDQGATASA